jgi:hypothetical protein
VEAIGGLVELVVGEAPPGGLVRRRGLGVDDGLVRVAPAAEGQQPLQAPAPEVVHPPTTHEQPPTQQCPTQPSPGSRRDSAGHHHPNPSPLVSRCGVAVAGRVNKFGEIR